METGRMQDGATVGRSSRLPFGLGAFHRTETAGWRASALAVALFVFLVGIAAAVHSALSGLSQIYL